jgi:porin
VNAFLWGWLQIVIALPVAGFIGMLCCGLTARAGEQTLQAQPQNAPTGWLAHQFNAASTDERHQGERPKEETLNNGSGEASIVPANPVPIELFAGNGDLGRALGIKPESGIRFGGSFVSDVNNFLAGSFAPNASFGNGIALLQLEANLHTLLGIKDSKISVAGLQFNGSPVNFYSGSIQGLNDLPSTPPYNRTELYTYWISKGFPSSRLHIRAGKMVANTLFNNVVLGNQDHPSRAELAVSGLTYVPLFVNPTLYNRLPASYNSALGLTAQWFPSGNGNTYVNYGIFDGNGARYGYQTGLALPKINSYLFQIVETGVRWNIGPQKLPAKFALGAWYQSGELATPQSQQNLRLTGSTGGATANGAAGLYFYGSHRLWYQRPWKDPSGVSMFYQFGWTPSDATIVQTFAGGGLTAFGLLRGRPHDNFGLGLAYSIPNSNKYPALFVLPALFPGQYKHSAPLSKQIGTPELMVQLYYQFHVARGTFLEPSITYIPKPSLIGDQATLAAGLRLIKLF